MWGEPHRPLPYAGPTGDAAASNVDKARDARAGIDPDAALHVADEYLIPPEYALAAVAKTAYSRDEHGQRTGVLPYLNPAWTHRRRARPLRNTEVAAIITALAPALHAHPRSTP